MSHTVAQAALAIATYLQEDSPALQCLQSEVKIKINEEIESNKFPTSFAGNELSQGQQDYEHRVIHLLNS